MTFSSRIGALNRGSLADRENQLTLLHQQILMRREALLHTSGSVLHHSSHSLVSTGTVGPADASIRNARLLKDIETLNQELGEQLKSVPSPRFATLQSNYWSMVRSLLPLWEQSLSGKQSSQGHQQRTHRGSGKSAMLTRATK